MAKPSIFSREYEKRMKKRKITTLITLLIVIAVISLIVLKVAYNPVDFSKIKQNMQAWIDSDSSNSAESTNDENVTAGENSEKQEQIVKEEPKELSFDVTLVSGKVAKAVYIENEKGERAFSLLKDVDAGVTYDISASKKQMVVCDTNSNMTLYNVDGSNKIVTNDKYVSSKGTVFTKDSTLASNPGYLWNATPKFLNEETIAFITNRPYFGTAATKQYIWFTNVVNGTETPRYDLFGQNVQIEGKEDNKLKVIIDGNVRYIGEDGNLVQ